MRRAMRSVLLCVLILALAFPATVLAEGITAEIGAKRSADNRYFPLTGHNVSGPFLSFFDRHGGVDVFGYPCTEAFEEDGRLVQYFQRHRMEYWPENPAPWRVQLALIGDLVLGPADPPVPPPADPAYRYFPETGHSIGPPFRSFFESRGGLTVFGYPTSEAYQDGPLLVQRFQRARLEWHPQNPPAHRVQPGLLGQEYIFNLGRVPLELTRAVPEGAAVSDWLLWGSWTASTSGYTAAKLHNNEVALQAFDGTVLKPGETFNFNRVLNAPGYVVGLGYGPNNTYIPMYAGGVCAAATMIYRAAFNAGIEILAVHPHTLVSYSPPGWDATVDGGRLDVVIRNYTSTDLRLRGSLDRQAGTITVWVEGRDAPDRTVARRGPHRLSGLTYEVFRDIIWADGRQTTERRRITYYGYPP